ncbi:hypothetical protein [Listeria booriae]|uniref:hypothetical protein n=1 Tax=Listeria booriae TaxID=1552123 RepID=UPI001627C7DC|nr:hypothetical protein [Listeria booriae]MBC2674021.1 hypothetical protein [Listeria booriae]
MEVLIDLNNKILNNYVITPSGLFSVPQLQFAIAEMGADHVIYSGDYPYLIDTKSRKFLEAAPISDEDREKNRPSKR